VSGFLGLFFGLESLSFALVTNATAAAKVYMLCKLDGVMGGDMDVLVIASSLLSFKVNVMKATRLTDITLTFY